MEPLRARSQALQQLEVILFGSYIIPCRNYFFTPHLTGLIQSFKIDEPPASEIDGLDYCSFLDALVVAQRKENERLANNEHRPVVPRQVPPVVTRQHYPGGDGTAAGSIPTDDQEPGCLTY